MVNGEWHVGIQTPRDLVGCAECGAVARVKDCRTVTVRDLPAAGVPVVIRWRKRIFECRYALCPNKTWTEIHPAIASRAVLTDRARQWAFEQVGRHDRAVARVAAVLGVAWHTIMSQVTLRAKPLIDDPRRLDGVSAVGVDETAFLRSCSTHPTLYATGIADVTPRGRPDCWTSSKVAPAPSSPAGSVPGTNGSGPRSSPPRSTRSVATPPRSPPSYPKPSGSSTPSTW